MYKFLAISLLSLFLSVTTTAQGQFLLILPNDNLNKPAHDFTLQSIDGPTLNLNKFRGDKRAVIFFWATWCPTCKEDLQTLNAAQDKLLKENIKIITVDLGEGIKTVKRYVKKNKITLPTVLDKDFSISENYDIVGTPTFVFIDEEGIIRSVEHDWPEGEYEHYFKEQDAEEINNS